MAIPSPLTIGPPLDWARISNHSVVRAVGFDQIGGGLPLVLAALRKGAESIDLSSQLEWRAEFEAVADHVRKLGLPTSLTAWDLRDQRIKKTIELVKIIGSGLADQDANTILRIFCAHVIASTVSDRQTSTDLLHGLIQVSKRASSRDVDPDRVRAWKALWPNLRVGAPFSPEEVAGKPKQIAGFCVQFNQLVGIELSPPGVTVTVGKLQTLDAKPTEQSMDQITPPASDDLLPKPEPTHDSESSGDALETSPKPPFLSLSNDWHTFLSSKAKFSTTSQRLGLDSWESLPMAHVLAICRRLAADIAGSGLGENMDAVLLVLSFLTGANLDRTLDLKLGSDLDDVHVNPTVGALCYPRQFSFPLASAGQAAVAGVFQIPLPTGIAEKLRQWYDWEPVGTLGGMFTKIAAPRSLQAFRASAHDRLKQYGDPHFLAWPGRWAGSGGKVFLELDGSDLMATVCTLSPQLSAPGALSYFHPAPADIQHACHKVYRRLGLDAATDTEAEAPWPDESTEILGDETLRKGFSSLIEDFKAACAHCQLLAPPEELFDAHNQATLLAAALVVFFCGGRGSRTDQLKFGSLYSSAKYLHLHDKELDDERGSRLLPKTPVITDVLDRYLTALASCAAWAVEWVHHNDRKTWRELSELRLRFDAIGFQTVAKDGGDWKRKPIEASDIEQVAQQYFGAQKNFMRHVLVTHWTKKRLDRTLLRVITGHSHDRLDMPSALSVYTPTSVLDAAGHQLMQLMQDWIDPGSLTPPWRPTAKFINLSLGRLHKVHEAYSAQLSESGTACHFGRWHLVAAVLVPRLRRMLLDGVTSLHPHASLLLHLLLIDALHDHDDLTAILSNLRIRRTAGGLGVQWQRMGERAHCTLPLQLPTVLLLRSWGTIPSSVDPVKAVEAAERWLYDSWAQDDQIARHDSPDGLFPQLVSAVRLWADLHLPGMTQFAYEADNHCVQMDVRSAWQLLGAERPASHPPVESQRISIRAPNSAREVQTVLEALMHAADRDKPHGGAKARLSVYKKQLAAQQFIESDTWPGVLNKCLLLSMEDLIAGKAHAIQFSSMATYLSALRPNLAQLPEHAPSDMRDLDFVEFARSLRVFEPVPGNAQMNAQRADQQRSAAHWLLKRMRDAGLRIPEAALHDRLREVRPRTAGSVAHVTSGQMDAAFSNLRKTEFQRSLQHLQAEVGLRLATWLPLRAGELLTLRERDLTVLDDQVLLQESRFDHLKSGSSWRRLHLPLLASGLVRELVNRIVNPRSTAPGTQYLFLRSGKGESSLDDAWWLQEWITTTFQSITGNLNFRLHALRGRSACERAFPDWESVLQGWQSAKFGPNALQRLFAYHADTAWRLEETRAALGHAAATTSVQYYLYNAGMMRAMACASTMTDIQPTAHLCAMVGVTEHALRKAVQRKAEFREEPWNFLAAKVVTHLPQEVAVMQKSAPSEEVQAVDSPSASTSSLAIGHKSFCRYLGLRLLEVSAIEAGDECGFSEAQSRAADSVFASQLVGVGSGLRARQKGTVLGRAQAADLRLFRSGGFELFYAAWGGASKATLENIRSFLTGEGDASTWEGRLRTLTSDHFVPKLLNIELVVGHRHANSADLARYGLMSGVMDVAVVRDQAAHPRVFVFPAQLKPNLVEKSRYLAVSRVVHKVLDCLMTVNGQSAKQTSIF